MPIPHQPFSLLVFYKKWLFCLVLDSVRIFTYLKHPLKQINELTGTEKKRGGSCSKPLFFKNIFPSYCVFLRYYLLSQVTVKESFYLGLMPDTPRSLPTYQFSVFLEKKQLILNHQHSRHFAHSHPCITSAEELAFHTRVGGIK